jgi:NTP pyrophosphatase (non-canonical NTP hydrolase)
MLEYSEMVERLAKPGAEILNSLIPSECHMLHMVLGISGEAGELVDAIKKAVIYNKPLDRANVVEELGDIEFYLEGLRQGLGISRAEVLEANMSKLSRRYQDGYSDAAAQARADKEGGE